MFRYPSCNLSTYDRREFPGGTVYNGDCLDVIKTLPESSVDCIVTDPPYFLGMTHNGQKGNFRDLSICDRSTGIYSTSFGACAVLKPVFTSFATGADMRFIIRCSMKS